ncbi:MAG: serine--tRNA ligase [Candidatus Nealsonbacteria bacterium CG_4_9_14_0_2_um_filter_37_38]|uniref:Serine--tRNA ligase n=1 Tax=Candidatus Nealsonbacteria bacterium CG_4_10_14_0_8_um_filter_37_14 TaxID=1974684 RepID=A0A2M7R6S2_9BACT|nr:MAG: serine--tRNA ligase [Candidatus Nealsonbacteria bacterium CG11_big_fil_rev_8_21_14_0_20_37_68]PIW92127.1 MAG: serine--tRNA ligase [Candidatus Nealsonbacteria bacterium CG_4_8_14_3_um_filter_37_23]PIY88577.1 MAG: serine--tRNA ligase [Candidatus Nealsonbacteria bacterium CG_4_10_14_0_8_um_filter_37_14]PJC51440.1 MAG: serine--tRNA ligase [Candidatus Nealsonbacteria bacterium CG_4_9_14_0_2_um_filter_37_38]
MLDIKLIRQNPQKVQEGCEKKQVKINLGRLLWVDKKRRQTIQALEDMKSQKNKTTSQIPKIEEEGEKEKLILKMRELDKNSDRLNGNLKQLQEEFNDLMRQIPNLPLENVPVGKNEKENVVLREIGEKPEFNFTPKDYLEISEKLDLIDVKRAAKVSGSRFGYLKGGAALIEFALINLAFETLSKDYNPPTALPAEGGAPNFIPVIPPVMLKPELMEGMGYVERGREEIYYLKKDKLYLVGTSEQSIGAMHADEIFEEKVLPKRYLGFSTCFRREAGAYGRDTKGILRVHQFDKAEMFSFCRPEKSQEEHQFFLKMEEKLMKALKIPYRVVQICSGDLGDPAAAKYDIEAWLPGQNQYRETHSTSNCTDYQARRLNIRYRDSKTEKPEFVHTVNGTAYAIGRTLIAIIENYQQKDGSIKVPNVLQKYTRFKKIG